MAAAMAWGEPLRTVQAGKRGRTGGKELSLSLPSQDPVELRVHDGALWVVAPGGDDDCARTIADSGVYFSSSPEIHVPNP